MAAGGLKILWVGNGPTVPSGYGQQAARNTPAIAALGHEVRIFATYGPPEVTEFEGIPVTTQQGPKFFGLDPVLRDYQPDVLLLLADPFVMDIERIGQLLSINEHTHFMVWDPIDTEPLPSPDKPLLDLADTILAMSLHGAQMLDCEGYESYYIPHCIPDGVFYPEEVEPYGNPLVGMVAANQGTRKLIPSHFEAVATARKTIRDLDLYVHTDLTGATLPFSSDFRELIRYFGLRDCVYSPDEVSNTPDEMRRLYNVFDLTLNCSAGEGFGVPIIESQACGTFVVTTDNSAMRFLNPYGVKVEPIVREYVPAKGAFYSWPHPDDVAAAIVDHFQTLPHDPSMMIDFAHQFEASRVANDYWQPLLNRIQSTSQKETVCSGSSSSP